MEKKYYGVSECAITAIINVIGGKWKLRIIWLLLEKTHRFGGLNKRIPGVALKVLSRQLKDLEADGIVKREVFAEVPPLLSRQDELFCRLGKNQPIGKEFDITLRVPVTKNK